MNHKNENEEDLPKLNISQENEFRKMKMGLELGAKFRDFNADKSLPPEIESHFLDHIANFEAQFKTTKKITIHKKIGAPTIIPAADLNEDSMSDELKNIFKKLKKSNIILDIIFEKQTEIRDLYEFLTTDFYDLEVDDIQMKGLQTCFLYEDFRPNHRCMMEHITKKLIKSFLNKDSKRFKKEFKESLELNDGLTAFRKSFVKFKLQSFQILDLIFEESSATVNFEIEFWGKINKNSEKLYFSGMGFVIFNPLFSTWEPKVLFLPMAAK